jgi:hypothetical protein
MKYGALKSISYEPPGEKPLRFQPGDVFHYPSKAFPTALPVEWLLAEGAIEKLKED